MKKLLIHPLFQIGFIARVALIVGVSPVAVTDWFVPFVIKTLSHPTWDPWGLWLAQGETTLAFPYGYVMWLVLIPFTALFELVSLPPAWGYGVTLLVVDLCLILVLDKLLPERKKLLLSLYWLSPIVLLATYGLGVNDVVPVLILMSALFFVRKRQMLVAGALCITAISAKFSMILALPFFFLYFLRNRALRHLLRPFLIGILVASMILILPFWYSEAGLIMLFSNPEVSKVYNFSLEIGNGLFIYIVPLAYFILFYAGWRIRRLNFELFFSLLGISFLLVVLLTFPSPGWFIWTIPMLVFYQAKSDRVAIVLVGLFSLLYIVSMLALAPKLPETMGHFTKLTFFTPQLHQQLPSLIHTAFISVGAVLALRIWREMVTRNDYFRLSRKPFVLGIAGNSGSGKDTLADAIKGLFGSHSVASISGDDYHLWDRNQPVWDVMTHLNPMANDLESFAADLIGLVDGQPITARRYDHKTGTMSRPRQTKSNELIIANGLHVLYLPILRSCFDLKIYLDIDENLRRYFRVQRDVQERGHSLTEVISSFERRASDSVHFIHPQIDHADLILSLKPIHPLVLDDHSEKQTLGLKLQLRSRNRLTEQSLMRVLIGVCGLHVDMEIKNNSTEIELMIEGETNADDIAMAARILCPNLMEFLDFTPLWQGGSLGLMQLVVLSHIDQALTRRLI